jgi:hypothetical protein
VVRHAADVVHAGGVAGAHVDEDPGGGAEHGVYLRFDLNWGLGENGWVWSASKRPGV